MSFAADTQVLTPAGWQLMPDLQHGPSAIARIDSAGAVDFVVPEPIVEQPHRGELQHIHGESIDLLVTADHAGATAWLAPAPADRPCGAGVRQSGRELSAQERHELDQAIAIHVDAYIRPDAAAMEVLASSDARARLVRQAFPTVERFHDTLAATVPFDDPSMSWVRLPAKDFRIDRLLELDGPSLAWFLERVMTWTDGSAEQRYGQSPERAASVEAMQIAAVLSGHATTWRSDPTGRTMVTIHPSVIWPAPAVAREVVSYDGMIYALAVSAGRVLVRRHGHVVACDAGGPAA